MTELGDAALARVTRASHTARIAFGSLWAYRLRSFLTALGVMVGVTTVIAIEGIIRGLDIAFKDQISALGTGTLYVSQHPWIILGDWWKFRGRPRIERADAEYLAAHLATAKSVVPFVYGRSMLRVGTAELAGVRVIGTTEDWPAMQGLSPSVGRFLSAGDVDAARHVVVIGADVAEVLRKEGIAVGGDLHVGGRRLKIIGFTPSRGSAFGQSQDDFIAIPLSLFERMFGKARSISIGIVYDPDDLERGTDEILGAMRTRRRLAPEQEDNFSVNQQQMFVDLYDSITRSLYATAVGLGFITLIVGGVGIMNIMLVAVAERTKEIGVRKALGARPATILAQFLVEAALVSGAGGALGTAFGLGVARLVAELTPLPATVSGPAILLGVGFGVFIGVVFGFLPAYRGARLLPVDALRAD